ncbi:uncharacterized protein LOC131481064 [Ochotona princeps]|uniref:uncharacterized protein LOC131481064 n=1 Tax=Ochotona princeps TaxID=9978 RepID=UPI0027148F70|nr:uncharacterized protein LOC131481064 [Ochotona princeps]
MSGQIPLGSSSLTVRAPRGRQGRVGSSRSGSGRWWQALRRTGSGARVFSLRAGSRLRHSYTLVRAPGRVGGGALLLRGRRHSRWACVLGAKQAGGVTEAEQTSKEVQSWDDFASQDALLHGENWIETRQVARPGRAPGYQIQAAGTGKQKRGQMNKPRKLRVGRTGEEQPEQRGRNSGQPKVSKRFTHARVSHPHAFMRFGLCLHLACGFYPF